MFIKAQLLALALTGACLVIAQDPTPQDVNTPQDATCLYQDDFTAGTYIINTAGEYRLCEDITFNPNPPAAGESPAEAFQPDYNVYDKKNYALGFFAAIAIEADGVDLYLDAYTLKQSPEHALMQRFFALIELASSPFLPAVGPHDFGNFQPAKNVQILGPGTLGLSSHHGIHGNENSNVVIEGITFENFEVAAASLNNADDLFIKNNQILNNRHNVPVVGMFSAAVFISKYGKYLKDTHPASKLLLSNGSGGMYEKSSENLYDELAASINSVYDHVINNNDLSEELSTLFLNPMSVVDGPCYAFVVHGKGPAVNGFGDLFDADETTTSSNIMIEDNIINDMKCWTKEIPGVIIDGKVQNDARGAVFQIQDTFTGNPIAMDATGNYVGNPVANMQLFVAEQIMNGNLPVDDVLQTGVNTISDELLAWARDGGQLNPYYRCNGDVMFHVGKGIVVIRVEDTINFMIRNNTISNIINLSVAPFLDCDDFHTAVSSENREIQQMGNVRAISVAAFRSSSEVNGVKGFNIVEGNTIRNLRSPEFPDYKTIGIDVQGVSDGMVIQENVIDVVPGAGPHNDPHVLGIRVRSNAVVGSIKVRNKHLVDEDILVEHLSGAQRRLGVAASLAGGCPFSTGASYNPALNPHFDL